MKPPIITFALPRSGSTLLLRLMNKCIDKNMKMVGFNGEGNLLDLFHKWIVRLNKNDGGGEKTIMEMVKDETFLSHYHEQKTQNAVENLKKWYWKYCGSHKTWGFKEVNYGTDTFEEFRDIITTINNCWPDTKFIFLDRDHVDVIRSMHKAPFFNKNGMELKNRVLKQIENYQMAINSLDIDSYVLTYEELLNYCAFKKFLNRLELTITQENYDKVIANKIDGV